MRVGLDCSDFLMVLILASGVSPMCLCYISIGECLRLWTVNSGGCVLRTRINNPQPSVICQKYGSHHQIATGLDSPTIHFLSRTTIKGRSRRPIHALIQCTHDVGSWSNDFILSIHVGDKKHLASAYDKTKPLSGRQTIRLTIERDNVHPG